MDQMETVGRVLSVTGGRVRVSVSRQAGCGRCMEPGGCGAATSPECSLVVDRQTIGGGAEVRSGDQVVLVVRDGVVWRAAVLAYVVPLLALFVGAIGGSSLWRELRWDVEVGAGAGAMLGLAIGAFISATWSRRVWANGLIRACLRRRDA